MSLDLVLLWLWFRSAAIAPVRPITWEPPYALGAALEKTKKKKKEPNCIISGCCGGVGSIPSLVQWVKGSCIATAKAELVFVVQIQSLAWELPYALGVAI